MKGLTKAERDDQRKLWLDVFIELIISCVVPMSVA